ncbi:MAG: hypothetical protein WC677_07670 [Clostridia bacterium]
MKDPDYFRYNWYSEIGPHLETGVWQAFTNIEAVFAGLEKRQNAAICRRYTVEFKYIDEE